jgi:hypothetical protein
MQHKLLPGLTIDPSRCQYIKTDGTQCKNRKTPLYNYCANGWHRGDRTSKPVINNLDAKKAYEGAISGKFAEAYDQAWLRGDYLSVRDDTHMMDGFKAILAHRVSTGESSQLWYKLRSLVADYQENPDPNILRKIFECINDGADLQDTEKELRQLALQRDKLVQTSLKAEAQKGDLVKRTLVAEAITQVLHLTGGYITNVSNRLELAEGVTRILNTFGIIGIQKRATEGRLLPYRLEPGNTRMDRPILPGDCIESVREEAP